MGFVSALALVSLFASSGGCVASEGVASEGAAPEEASVLDAPLTASNLRVSTRSDRSSAVSLDGQTLTGQRFVFVTATPTPREVAFYVDDPNRTRAPFRIEGFGPFDLAGTANDNSARPFDASSLGAGSHTITVRVTFPSGTVETTTGRFTVGGSMHRKVKIMPLGDSITEGWIHVPGGYRIRLWQRVVRDEGKNIDFVGSLQHGPTDLGDRDHEGHSGWRIDQIRANVDTWLDAQTPDAVLLHIGTNDVVQNYQMTTAPDRLRDLTYRICQRRPGVKLVIASIIPRPGLSSRVDAYNAKIPDIVAALVRNGCDARFVDMNAALTSADLDESVTHPTRAGFDKMADAWYAPVKTIYGELD